MDIRVQELLEKIKRDGVEHAEAEAAKILADAEKKRADVIAAAEKEAKAIVAKAESDAARAAESGRAALTHRITSYNVCYTKLLRVASRGRIAGLFEYPSL